MDEEDGEDGDGDEDALTWVCSGCLEGMVLVTEEDCRSGGVDLCPPTCSHLSSSGSCTDPCVPGEAATLS